MKVVKVTLDSFELENGTIWPIDPPLVAVISPEEFQLYYDRLCKIIKNIIHKSDK